MLFDSMPQGIPWEPLGPLCKSCKRPIALDEPKEEVRFEPDAEHQLEEMNGTYHVSCAKPFVSMARALDMMRRAWF